jgi:hypothetical protein
MRSLAAMRDAGVDSHRNTVPIKAKSGNKRAHMAATAQSADRDIRDFYYAVSEDDFVLINAEIDYLCAFAANAIAFRVADNPIFRQMVKSLPPTAKGSARVVTARNVSTRALNIVHAKVTEDLVRRVAHLIPFHIWWKIATTVKHF